MTTARHTALNKCRRSCLLVGLISLLLLSVPAHARKQPQIVAVEAPYVDMHSGPGRGYPVFHTVERGDEVALLKRRTDWFKVRTSDGTEGWVDRRVIEDGALPGTPLRGLRDAALDDYLSRRVEMGFATSDFDGDQGFTFRGGYRLSEHFLAELFISEVSGTFSSSTLYGGNLLVQPLTIWRMSPFFTVGMGRFENDPKDVLVDDQEIEAWTANAGVGIRGYVARRFLLRAEYRQYTVLVNDNSNEDFDEWSLGFSVFF